MSDQADDRQLLDLLDDYLARLQAGRRPDREALVREHPELASALDCLEALEGLAPPEEEAGSADGQHDTIAIESSMGELPRPFGQYELLDEIGNEDLT